MPSNSKGRGVLPVNSAQTKKPPKQAPRPPAPRLRLIVRRLPPGLTETEFWDSMGAEWLVGKGKVDWAAYKSGKISRDLAKPSRPSRAYLKVKEPAQLDLLSAHVKAITFQDTKNTIRDPCLFGPPSLEFAPYNKIPSGRLRHDGRQGTIDQDPEFIDFLQSLTEPITKGTANGDPSEGKLDKVAITPLVQYIKDKKANKAKEKEAVTVKATKKGTDNKDPKAAPPAKADQTTVVKKTGTNDAEKVRVAKATQQAVDSIKRSVAEIKGQSAPAKQETQPSSKTPVPSTQSTPKKERQRGDASAVARIIGRDLGLVPKEGRSPRTPRAVSTPTPTTSNPPTAIASAAKQQGSTPIAPSAAVPAGQAVAPLQPPTGPRNLRNATPQSSPLRPSPMPQSTKPTKPSPQPSTGAKSAFLKHANPSQGVTEELLRAAFVAYGAITRCEIDKKKGLGYVDFADTDGLRKAMAASPIKVGNGSVVVLENRSPYKKATSTPSRPNTASPITSTASSPQVSHAALMSIAGQASTHPHTLQTAISANEPSQALPGSSSTEPLPHGVLTSEAPIAAATPAQATTGVTTTTDMASPSTTEPVPSSASRGGGARGNNRGFRGRGNYRGRGGPFRGSGNRAASTPASGIPTQPAATSSAGPGGNAANGGG